MPVVFGPKEPWAARWLWWIHTAPGWGAGNPVTIPYFRPSAVLLDQWPRKRMNQGRRGLNRFCLPENRIQAKRQGRGSSIPRRNYDLTLLTSSGRPLLEWVPAPALHRDLSRWYGPCYHLWHAAGRLLSRIAPHRGSVRRPPAFHGTDPEALAATFGRCLHHRHLPPARFCG